MPFKNPAARDRLIVENVPDVVWLAVFAESPPGEMLTPLDVLRRLRFTYFTPSIRQFGYEPEEALQLSLLQLMTAESAQRASQFIGNRLQAGDLRPGPNALETREFDGVHKNGTAVRCEISATILADEQGRPVGCLGVGRDVSRRRLAEDELRDEQRILRQLLDLQERERQLLAYEIHDGLVQQMTGSLMHFEAAISAAPTDANRLQREADIAGDLLRESIREARRLISGLRPPILDEHGIAAAIEYLANETRRERVAVELDIQMTTRRLIPQLENTLFRIVQEALTNVVRHSRAPQVTVAVRQTDHQIQVTVADDGIGFLPDQVPQHRFGLRGIRERAKLLGGAARILSRPGAGTRIEVELPLLPAADSESPAS